MCTVLLRFSPGEPWPVLVGAVRDEFTDREWDAPARHWTGERSRLVGGRDRKAGGTWLAVDPTRPALAALLNGPVRPPLDTGDRPTRGELALRVLSHGDLPRDLSDHDRFHLLRATPESVELWSWDGDIVEHRAIEPGTHVIVNSGLDALEDPLVPHFAPRLAMLPAPSTDLAAARAAWLHLLAGDGLDPADERALLVRREVRGRPYASTSATFVALAEDSIDYAFSTTPADPDSWHRVATGPPT